MAECVWCMADRQTFIGCCGRERAHHHTMTKWRGDVVRIIPSDDCPEAPLPSADERFTDLMAITRTVTFE